MKDIAVRATVDGKRIITRIDEKDRNAVITAARAAGINWFVSSGFNETKGAVYRYLDLEADEARVRALLKGLRR